MSISSKTETVVEEGQDKPAVTITFTNGAKQQLEELQVYYKEADSLGVVKLAISFLQRMKELEEKKKSSNEH